MGNLFRYLQLESGWIQLQDEGERNTILLTPDDVQKLAAEFVGEGPRPVSISIDDLLRWKKLMDEAADPVVLFSRDELIMNKSAVELCRLRCRAVSEEIKANIDGVL